MAKPGFGKQSAPGQEPRRGRDFAHLPKREAAIAGYIDRLPDGAGISIKTLARELDDFGQCAIGTALRRLSEAGHLRRVRRDVQDAEGARWVYRTYFTRTARPDAWWAAFLGGDVPQSGTADPAPAREPDARGRDALARLVHQHPQLALSAVECEALAGLAGDWFRRGATEAQFVRAVASMLPDPVRHPFGFVQSRLIRKLPPVPPAPVQGRYVMECTDCHAPGTPESLPGSGKRSVRTGSARRPEPSWPDVITEGSRTLCRVKLL
ncbi:hypothetical protein ACWDZ4_27110 [Streptomyces sp. NPDC003016]